MEFDDSMVIARDTMQLIILDLHLIDGAYVMDQRDGSAGPDIADPYFQMLLKKYNITPERFEESMKYYTYHIEEMNAMFDQAIDELGRMESEGSSLKESD